MTMDGKLAPEHIYDLSVHKIDDLLQNFRDNSNWDSILIDSRSVTICDNTFSLNTDFSYKFKKSPKNENDDLDW